MDANLSQADELATESVTLFRELKDDGDLAEVLVTQGRRTDACNTLAEALRASVHYKDQSALQQIQIVTPLVARSKRSCMISLEMR